MHAGGDWHVQSPVPPWPYLALTGTGLTVEDQCQCEMGETGADAKTWQLPSLESTFHWVCGLLHVSR